MDITSIFDPGGLGVQVGVVFIVFQLALATRHGGIQQHAGWPPIAISR